MYLDLVAKLEHQGFIRKTSTDGRFVVIREQKKVSDARSNYLDPLARILDYVSAILFQDTLSMSSHLELRLQVLTSH